MSDQKQNFQMTAKLPLLIIGIVLALGGWFITLRWRGRFAVLGGVMMAGGVALLVWSSSIHQWCAPTEHKFGHLVWGQATFQESPSLRTCFELVGIIEERPAAGGVTGDGRPVVVSHPQ